MDTGDSTSTSDTSPTTLPPDPSTSVSSVDTTVTPDDTSTTGDPDTTGSTSTGSTDTGSTGSTDTGSTGTSTDTGSTGTSTDTGSTGTSTDTGSTGTSTDTGESSSSSGGMQQQGFAECSVDETQCLDQEGCVADDPAAPTVTVCTDLDCVSPDECPTPPPGGTAEVACQDITGDMVGDCFIDCSTGDTCPTGMECALGLLCAWPLEPAVAEGYADCAADDTVCLAQEQCVFDDPDDPTISVCTDLDCLGADECPSPPPGGTAPVTCDDVTNDMVDDCFIDCSGGGTCPTGMDCFAGFICAWPVDLGPPGEGYGDCGADPDACLPEELCVSDDPPTVIFCSDLDCDAPADCPTAPGGTAPVACEDITGDMVGDCFLDCSLGNCPAGMNCFGGFICAWPV